MLEIYNTPWIDSDLQFFTVDSISKIRSNEIVEIKSKEVDCKVDWKKEGF